jgi:hypothetical protein
MQFFFDFLERNGKLRDIIGRISQLPGHQGTIIRFSDEFLSLYILSISNPSEFNHFIKSISSPIAEVLFQSKYLANLISSADSKGLFYRDLEIDKINEFIGRLTTDIQWYISKPIEVIFSIYDDANPREFTEYFNRENQDEQYSLSIEKRNRNLFLNTRVYNKPLIGGISIGAADINSYGTLGGFVKDKQGNIYGLTCAHVAKPVGTSVYHPSQFDSKESRDIGKVVFSSKLTAPGKNEPCNAEYKITNMDVSLIKVSKKFKCCFGVSKLGNVTRTKPFKEIVQGMKLEFNARTTNKRKALFVGGICVSYKVSYHNGYSNNLNVCFNNLIELRTIPYRIFGLGFCNNPPVLSGDSGAWLCSNDTTGYSWAGMLISGDVDRGYFISSEHIIKHLSENKFDVTP